MKRLAISFALSLMPTVAGAQERPTYPFEEPPAETPPPFHPAPPYQPRAEQPTPYRPEPSDPGDTFGHAVKLEAGGGYRRLDTVGFVGMDYRGGVGASNDHIAHYFTGGFVWGESSQHLRTYATTFGYNLDLTLVDVFRMGFGIEASYLWVRRASTDARMWALGAGAFIHAMFDIVKLGRSGRDALYADVRLQGTIHFTDVAFWGPSLSAGFRF